MENRRTVPWFQTKEWSIAAEPSCAEKGMEVGECVRCGSTVEKAIPVIGHTPGDWVVVTEPSVGQDGKAVSGLRSYSCTVCGQNLHRKAENAFFFEVYEQILCPLKKNIQF